jgi:hypothetical protein
MTLRNALRVVRISAVYDLVITVGFAFWFTAAPIFDLLGVLHETLRLAGATPDPADPITLLFANLMGSVVTIWALFRIFRPSLEAGAADVGARVLFSLGMVVAILHGASPLVLGMLILEVAWALVQSAALLAARPGVTADPLRTAGSSVLAATP